MIFSPMLAVPTGLLQEVQQSTTTLDLMAMASGYESDATECTQTSSLALLKCEVSGLLQINQLKIHSLAHVAIIVA